MPPDRASQKTQNQASPMFGNIPSGDASNSQSSPFGSSTSQQPNANGGNLFGSSPLKAFTSIFGAPGDNASNSAPSSFSFGQPYIPMDLFLDKTTNTLIAKFELAGFTKDDVEVTICDGDLVVSALRNAPPNVPNFEYSKQERRYGKFEKKIPLPRDVKDDDIKASIQNGLLTVTMPKIKSGATKKIIVT